MIKREAKVVPYPTGHLSHTGGWAVAMFYVQYRPLKAFPSRLRYVSKHMEGYLCGHNALTLVPRNKMSFLTTPTFFRSKTKAQAEADSIEPEVMS